MHTTCRQVRQLKYDGGRNLELDNILLIGAQTGLFIYSVFTIIGGHFTIEKNTVLVLITALASLLQTTCQTMFVLDASRRSCVTPEQIRRKPGRELVTFLLVTNLAMWAINTLEKSRAESHPIQLHFYGLWAWTIITHVSMPLAIFYRWIAHWEKMIAILKTKNKACDFRGYIKVALSKSYLFPSKVTSSHQC